MTLQPIRRFGMDGAILFSDILVIPYALGVNVTFAKGEGPVVEQVDAKRIDKLKADQVGKKLSPIFETLRRVKKELPKETTLIGFAGAPWTVACYMLQGPRDKEFSTARKFAYENPKAMKRLIDTLSAATIEYLRLQANNGAEALQLFDSWAGLLSPEEFARRVLAPTARIAAALKKSHPKTPLIGFARGAGQHLSAYAKTGVHALGVDTQTPMRDAIEAVGKRQAVQGNLDPLLLASDKKAALKQAREILKTFGTRPAVFNLGHGMVPETPLANVEALCELLRSAER